jgi:hypothetical protein
MFLQITRVSDISAAEARAGKDMQGIPWERLNITRQDYRKARLEQYKNYENFPQSGELMDKVSSLTSMLIYQSLFYYSNCSNFLIILKNNFLSCASKWSRAASITNFSTTLDQ